jgi:hypothetical protein
MICHIKMSILRFRVVLQPTHLYVWQNHTKRPVFWVAMYDKHHTLILSNI